MALIIAPGSPTITMFSKKVFLHPCAVTLGQFGAEGLMMMVTLAQELICFAKHAQTSQSRTGCFMLLNTF